MTERKPIHPKKKYPDFEQPVYHEKKTHWFKKLMKSKIPVNPRLAFWVMFTCFISLGILAFITTSYQNYEPKMSKFVVRPNVEKLAAIEKDRETKEYFRKYLKEKYPLYDAHLNYVLDCIFDQCKAKDISPLLVIGVIEVESGFDFQAKSAAGAIGLMQVHAPSWGRSVGGEKNLYDPCVNISKGTSILQDYIRQNRGDVQKALGSYLGAYDGAYNARIMSLVGSYYLNIEKIHAQNKVKNAKH